MTNPCGLSFLSYRRARLNEAKMVIAHQHDLGIPTWQDVENLGVEKTEDALRSTLKDPQIANAVLWITPDVDVSNFIQRIEIPLILERHKKGDGFFFMPVATGGLDYEDAGQAVQKGTGIEALTQWNIQKVVSDPTDESEIRTIAAKILSRRIKTIHQHLSPKEPLRAELNTRTSSTSAGYFPLTIDWTHRFDGRIASDETWRNHLLPALSEINEQIRTHAPGRTIRAKGQLCIPAATALGYYFMAPGNIDLTWEQHTVGRPSQEWSLQHSRVDSEFEIDFTTGSNCADDLAVLVSVNANVLRAVESSHNSLPKFRAFAHVKPKNATESGNIELRSSGEAVDVAHRVMEAARIARHRFPVHGRLHLFMAVPVGLAVLIGQLLNTLGPVQTYEHIPESVTGHYRAAGLLGN